MAKSKLMIMTLSIIVLANFRLVCAQNEFKDGYIITHSNDTIRGYIDNRGSSSNSKTCIFKKDLNGIATPYKAGEIKAYRYQSSKYYIAKCIENGTNIDTVFMEYLIKGAVDIYFYRDRILGDHYYAQKGDSKLLELKNDEYEVEINNTKQIKRSKEYSGILKYMFRETPSLYSRIDELTLDHESLIKIASDYHREVCKEGKCIVYEKEKTTSYSEFGILIGINITSITTNNDYTDELLYMKNSHFTTAIYPSLGIFVKKRLTFINERSFFQYEVCLCKWGSSTHNELIETLKYDNNITFNHTCINNTILFKYDFPAQKWSPTIGVGFFINQFLTNQYNRSMVVRYTNGLLDYKEESTDTPFTSKDYGLSFCGGVKGKLGKNGHNIYLDIRYQRGMSMLNDSGLKGAAFFQNFNTNTFTINLGVQLSK